MSFSIAGRQLNPIFIQKETPALVLSLQLIKPLRTTFFNTFFNTLKKALLADIYRKSNYSTFYIQDFCISSCDDNEVYKVLSVEKNSLKVVNNAIDDIGL